MKTTSNVVHATCTYVRRGWRVIPIPSREKAPRLKGWQHLRISEDEVEDVFDEDSNVGVLLGKPSKNLTDVDLDCPEAILLAQYFLPPTARIHG